MTNSTTRKQKRGAPAAVPKGVEYLPINESYPGIRKVNVYPPVYVIDDFLTPEECDTLIEMSKDRLQVSEVVNENETGKSNLRQSNSAYYPYTEVPFLKEKGEALLGRSSDTFEQAQVTYYTQDGFYRAHLDSFDTKTAEGQRAVQNGGGQRVATVLMYLTSNHKGGGTYFPKISKRFMPKKGRAVLFFPARVDGTEEPLNLHRAEKVHGEKWVSQIWVREREL